MTAADLAISVSSQEGTQVDEGEGESSEEDERVESVLLYYVPVTTDPFYTLLSRARALSSSELTARNVFALAIKNALDRVTSKPSLFRLPSARLYDRFIRLGQFDLIVKLRD